MPTWAKEVVCAILNSSIRAQYSISIPSLHAQYSIYAKLNRTYPPDQVSATHLLASASSLLRLFNLDKCPPGASNSTPA